MRVDDEHVPFVMGRAGGMMVGNWAAGIKRQAVRAMCDDDSTTDSGVA
jgi:hypothetical protein